MDQIARAGGGHPLVTPAGAFADDLLPVNTPLPLQRVLLLLAAILLPIEVGLRRLRISPFDVWDWLRHPRRVALDLPWAAEGLQPAAWMPGAWRTHRVPPPVPIVRPFYSEATLGAPVTPRLARQDDADSSDGEEEALAATLKWLAARRGGSHGDRG
jgi:hypothetical protein